MWSSFIYEGHPASELLISGTLQSNEDAVLFVALYVYSSTMSVTSSISRVYILTSGHLLIRYKYFVSGVVCDEFCRRENVSGAEGGEVILRVHQTGITFIYWILLPEGDVLITTEPGESIDESDVIDQYKGRLRSEADGSLHLRNLSPQDQKIYKADIRKEEHGICVQFNLTVYERLSPEDIKINHSITRNDTCSLGLLCTVDKRDVTVTWSNLNSSDINVTQGVLYIPPSSVDITYICTARNPVSNVSETVIPGKYCQTDSLIRKFQKDLGTILLTRWILCGVVLLITGCVFIHHIRTEVMDPPNRYSRRRH
ncbi:SLAM family member 9-like [Rhinoderma darwinii]|uniref:SLAM family member 9-like n=1 Tax=Rhinoderma darwinii TaxID=43563 RepID=UPI003F67CBD2